jgi:hypothetical protein
MYHKRNGSEVKSPPLKQPACNRPVIKSKKGLTHSIELIADDDCVCFGPGVKSAPAPKIYIFSSRNNLQTAGGCAPRSRLVGRQNLCGLPRHPLGSGRLVAGNLPGVVFSIYCKPLRLLGRTGLPGLFRGHRAIRVLGNSFFLRLDSAVAADLGFLGSGKRASAPDGQK